MKVKVFACDGNGNETLERECDLRECFPDNDDDYQDALVALTRNDRYWAGGGAAPLTLIMRA